MARRAARPAVDVSVIIVNYNVREYLANALVALRSALRGLRSEIFVVDNASTDGSAAMVRSRFPAVQLIASGENLGFARANNLALRKSRGRFILLINPDTLVQEDTVRVMVQYLEAHAEVGLAGCRILNPDGSFQLAARRSYPTPWVAFTRIAGLSRLFPRSRTFGRYNLTYRSTEEECDVDAVSGSFMFLRREVYRRVGGLDEAYFMYGEDLDWCFRIRKAGWSIRYVPSTAIIHYKGESTRRSSIDEIRTFYDAMEVFVRKHFRTSAWQRALLRAAIRATSMAATMATWTRRFWPAIVDGVLVVVCQLLAEWLWRGGVLMYPGYAYPAVFVVPALIVVAHLLAAGVYTHRSFSISRTWVAVLVSFVVIAAVTAFFKEYAFSRMMVVITGGVSSIALPGWRVALRYWGRRFSGGRPTLFGRRTLIVGTSPSSLTIAAKLRSGVAQGFDVIGFLSAPGEPAGGSIAGLPIVGTMDSVVKAVHATRATDVVVPPGIVPNRELLSMVARASGLEVGFHVVPGTMEVLIGKASVESLERLPLVEVTYNIERRGNRAAKRLLDVALASVLLITAFPFVYLTGSTSFRKGRFLRFLPSVLSGTFSLVGPPEEAVRSEGRLYLGRPGLTGLVQLQEGRELLPEERDQYLLSYARNQSVLLDLEILLKTFLESQRRPHRGR